jgi:hypothetical protein
MHALVFFYVFILAMIGLGTVVMVGGYVNVWMRLGKPPSTSDIKAIAPDELGPWHPLSTVGQKRWRGIFLALFILAMVDAVVGVFGNRLTVNGPR